MSENEEKLLAQLFEVGLQRDELLRAAREVIRWNLWAHDRSHQGWRNAIKDLIRVHVAITGVHVEELT